MTGSDPSARFVAAAARLGHLAPAAAQALLARAAQTGRPAWELAPAAGLSPAAVEAALRALRGASTPGSLGGPPPGLHDETLPLEAPLGARPPAARAPAASPPVLRYEVRDELGRGGMGRVLRVLDPAIGREVAQKVLLDPAADPAARARFVHEARVTGQLEHPGIVPVHEAGEGPDGAPYFTMKLVRGRSLAQVVKATRQAPDHAAGAIPSLLRAFLRVCEALAYAHDRGVVHRDLKPANVMLGDFGEVLVMDWGLARLVGEAAPGPAGGASAAISGADVEATQEGAILGTPAYMPPEQAEGSRSIDARSDIYSLGAILYELLTLRPVFTGETPLNIVKKVLTQEPVPPRQAAPERRIPRELEAIALVALRKDPAGRYPTALALAEDVRRFLDGLPVTALPAGPVTRLAKWVGRHAELSAGVGAATVLLALVAGVSASLLSAGRAERERLARAEAETRLASAAAVASSARAEAQALDAARRSAQELVDAAVRRSRALEAYLRVEDALRHDTRPSTLAGTIVPGLVEAVRIDPTFTEGHLRLGEARMQQGRNDEARAAFEAADRSVAEASARAGSGPPGSSRARYLLGLLAIVAAHERGQDTASAMRAAAEAVRAVDRDDPLATALELRLQAPAAALEGALELVRRHPQLFEPRLAVVDALNRLMEDDERAGRDPSPRAAQGLQAVNELVEGLQLDVATRGHLAKARQLRGRIVFRSARASGDRRLAAQAAAELGEVATLVVDDAGWWQQVTLEQLQALLLADDAAGARALVERIAALDARSPVALQLLGEWFVSRGESAAALPLLVRAGERCEPGSEAAVAVAQLRLIAAAEAGSPEQVRAAASALASDPPRATRKGSFAVAEEALRLARALGAARAALAQGPPPGDPTVARVVDGLLRAALGASGQATRAAMGAGDFATAERTARVGLALADALGPDADRTERLNLLGAHAAALQRLGRWADALLAVRASLDANDRSSPELQARAAADSFNLAVALLQTGARADAIAALEQAAAWGFRRADLVRSLLGPLLDEPRVRALLDRM